MDTFFISHGAPPLVLDESISEHAFLRSWKSSVLQETPKAILMVSAHWDTDVPTVSMVHGTNDTIHDFVGFPSEMYQQILQWEQLTYPAPGAPDVAQRAKELLDSSGPGPVKCDNRGLDHATWVLLMLMYPEANVPVCQLSLQTKKGTEYHYNLGKALEPLRDEGVLIIGSGNAIHNFGALRPASELIPKWAADFDTWLMESLLDGRFDDVNNYEEKAPSVKMAHPTPEHLLPLHVVLGAAGEGAKVEMIHSSWTDCTVSHASFRFTSAKVRT